MTEEINELKGKLEQIQKEHKGKLEKIQTIPVEGNWPRNFTLDPTGRFLLVANQQSNNITVFRVDEVTGKLAFTGRKFQNESPVCLQFLK